MRGIRLLLVLLAVFCETTFPALAQLPGEYPPALQPESGVCNQLEALQASEAIDPDVALKAAAALEFGTCSPADSGAAARLYEKAAAGGFADASIRLAVLYSYWRGGLDNPLKADREFRTVAAGVLTHDPQFADLMPEPAARTGFLARLGIQNSAAEPDPRLYRALLALEAGDRQSAEALQAAFAWWAVIEQGPESYQRYWALRLDRSAEPVRAAPSAQRSENLAVRYDYLIAAMAQLATTPRYLEPQTPAEVWQQRQDHLLEMRRLAAAGFGPAQLDLGIWIGFGLNGLSADPAGGYGLLGLAAENGFAVGPLQDWLVKISDITADDRSEATASASRGRLAWPQFVEGR